MPPRDFASWRNPCGGNHYFILSVNICQKRVSWTDVDRLPWKSQSELCVVRATNKFKSLGFVCTCSPSFFSLSSRRVPPFSRGVIFTHAPPSLALLSLRKKDYSKSNVGYHLRQNEENVTWVMCHVFLFFRRPVLFQALFCELNVWQLTWSRRLKAFFDLWYRQQQHHQQHNVIERLN